MVRLQVCAGNHLFRWVLLLCMLLGSFGVWAQTIQITDVKVSGCYLDASGTNSKGTVRFLVRWSGINGATASTNANPRNIRITATGLANKDIVAGVGTYGISSLTIVSPQEFALEFPLTAAPSNVTLTATMGYLAGFLSTYTASTLANTKATFTATLPAACPKTPCSTTAIGGIVFNDYNADGVRSVTTTIVNTIFFGSTTVTSGETQGVPDVRITATDNAGNSFTTLTDDYGFYAFTQSMSYPVRVEFTEIPAAYLASATPNGSGSRTTTQFITGASCTVNLGVNASSDYCNTSPKIFTPCYVNGDPTKGGTAGTGEALVSVPLNAAGNNFTTATTGGANAYWALTNQTGATWGLAWSKQQKKLFQSAILRRHVGFGPLGIGGIYVTSVASNTTAANTALTTSFVDLDAAPFNVPLSASFVGGATPNANRDLPATKAIVINGAGNATSGPSRDAIAFSMVGKEGLGDLEIADDGNTLYTINLKTKELLSLDLTNYNATGTIPNSAAQLTTTAIPDPGCVSGVWRPWATKVYQGDLYIGGVCDASLTAVGATTPNQRKSNLWAYVYKYDGTAFTTVLDFPLTYPKGFPYSSIPDATGWYPWTDNFSDLLNTVISTEIVYPQPILMDIEFDTDGSMILGLGDRTAHQTGVKNVSPVGPGSGAVVPMTIPQNSTLYTSYNGGDVLKAYAKNGIFILENNGQAGPFEGYGAGNNQGPGFGEYFNDDWFFNGTKYHAEAMLGGLALRPGSGQTLAVSIDPQDGTAWAGGIRLMNNNTGLRVAGYSIYSQDDGSGSASPTPGTLGKAAGLGDLEINCDEPKYLQIGNRAWFDKDADGVQDPGEPVLAGLSVKLYLASAGSLASPISTTTTGANGEYLFSNLLPNTAYVIVFGDGQQVSGIPQRVAIGGINYELTTPNVGQGAAANLDLNDSDATLQTAGTFANKIAIPVTTGLYTQDNHTLDIGVTCLQPTSISLVATPATCNGTTPQNNGSVVLSTSVTNGDRYAIVSGTVTTGFTYATATAIGTTFPKSLTTGVSNAGATYTVRFYNGSNDCYIDQVVVVDPKSCVCVPPVVLITSSGSPVCTTATATLSAAVTPAGSYTYAWVASAGVTLSGANTATATASGFTTGLKTFTVTVTSGPGCFTTATVSLSAISCVGCSISLNPAVPVQSACNDNGTPTVTTDDYFTVTVNAAAISGGASNKYELVLGANPDGTGGTVLNAGGTTYGTAATVGTAITFMANGSSTYLVTARDLDTPTCKTTFTTTAVQSCSSCPPQICIPMTGLKQ
ncbi:SdrD B-like domain-containing protein [Fibrella aquatilis]|uniref:SD-repeat containing protein B domain-containing protein n=1 Tax=Fibrella aquatilis TaxID=2817059 RepID=A0A939GAX6_9BACT|nr:SdrD B-like domain-containing protein [Fibrella aquatilis]MBO0934205.1 hypothetical protein [Fibrella aquatilis]